MPRLPRVTGDKAVAAFEKAGWRVVRVTGSHHIMVSDNSENRLSIPVHAGKTVGPGLLRAAGKTQKVGAPREKSAVKRRFFGARSSFVGCSKNRR